MTRGSLATFAAMVLAAAAALLVQMLLSNTLGEYAFGDYAYSLGWVNLLTVGAVLGFEAVVVRYTATYRATSDWGRLRGLLRFSTRTSVMLALGIGAAIALAALIVPSPTLGPVLLAAAPLLPILAVMRIVAAGLQGLKRPGLSQLLQALRPVGMGLALIAGSALAGWRPSAPEAMLLNLGTTAATLAIGWIAFRAVVPGQVLTTASKSERSAWTATLGPMTWMTAGQVVLVYTDVLMVGTIIDTREAGIYSVAVQLVMVLGFGIAAINTVAAPIMAELHVAAERDKTQSLLTLATRGTLAYTLVAGSGLALCAGWILNLYGPGFAEGTSALLILVGGQVVIGSCGPAGFLPTMTGREREASRFVLGSAAANVVLNAALIPWFGMPGAAIATAVSGGGRSLLMAWWVRQRLGYRPGINLAGRSHIPPAKD